MRHPSEGVLRRLIDEPAGVTDDDRAHVAGCATCLQALETARADARLVGAALAPSAARRHGRGLGPALGDAPRRPLRHGRRDAVRPAGGGPAIRRPAVAALSAAVLLTGAGVAAANDWLPIFRTEQVAPIEVSSTDLVQLPDLSAYGDLAVTARARHASRWPTPRRAEERTGLAVPAVGDLPEGVTGDPTYQAAGVMSATFTFSAEKAAQAAAAEGEALPPPPAGLDGSSLRLEAGPAVAAVWSQPTGMPTLVVARVVAPTVYSSGVPFDDGARLPAVAPRPAPGLATQLRDLSDERRRHAAAARARRAGDQLHGRRRRPGRDGAHLPRRALRRRGLGRGRRDDRRRRNAQPGRGAVGRPWSPLTPLASGA